MQFRKLRSAETEHVLIWVMRTVAYFLPQVRSSPCSSAQSLCILHGSGHLRTLSADMHVSTYLRKVVWYCTVPCGIMPTHALQTRTLLHAVWMDPKCELQDSAVQKIFISHRYIEAMSLLHLTGASFARGWWGKGQVAPKHERYVGVKHRETL